ncbi:MAG: hypothetical protein A3F12_00010 [Gammaproteobacteria bacterium RIFCSPHIGHO2_12_FULL_38_14]|nr:MAG: hypothetical protein A3F12_00010 [Gammaproteobacteria bacterium RIFCSPHIGHO2_12_FULL_38_14]
MKKIALITGAGRGIGFEIASLLSQFVDHLILVDKNTDSLKNFSKLDQNKLKIITTDLSSTEQTCLAIRELLKEGIFPNIIINNAGYGGDFQTIEKISYDLWDDIFNINVKSHFLFSKNFLPYMKKKHYGRIVSIVSVQGFLGAPLSSAYVSSKHAALGLMKTIASEWGMYGITSNAISPGYVKTSMGAQNERISDHEKNILSLTPAKRMAAPQEIASLVQYLLSENASFINGENIVIDGGLTCYVGTQDISHQHPEESCSKHLKKPVSL